MRQLLSIVLAGLVVGGSIYILLADELLVTTLEEVASMGAWAYVVFILLLVAAVVLAPVTVLPLTPVASQLFGPFVTGLLSVVGWTIGSVIAFLLARYAGRPLLERYVSLEKADALAAELPEQNQFWFIVIARHLIPVDVLSYALGLVSTVSLKTFAAATVVGVIWFSFAFAYLGEAFFTGNVWLFTEIALASLAVLAGAWYTVRYRKGRERERGITKK